MTGICPRCETILRGRYCPRCGAPALALAGRSYAVAGELRSLGVAYGLWALCLVGAAGVHRFYAARYLTGVLWLVTWGLLGIGLLYDLLVMPRLVDEANRRLA